MMATSMGMDIIVKAENYVRSLLKDETSGHDYWHCIRVKNMALKISEYYECDKTLIALAAVLHDIDDAKVFANNGQRHLNEFCELNNIDIYLRDKISSIINFLTLDKRNDLVSVETQIVQDADNLDALGAVGLARMFAFGGANGMVMYDGTESDSYSHYYHRLVNLIEIMNTSYAKELAKTRIKFMHDFINKFKLEIQIGDSNG